MRVGIDESGGPGSKLLFGSVSCEREIERLARFYITDSYGVPFPGKPRQLGTVDQERKLFRCLRDDPRFSVEMIHVPITSQFEILRRFAELEERENIQLVNKVSNILSALDGRLFSGLPPEYERSEFDAAVQREPHQSWNQAVGGYFHALMRRMRTHQRYLKTPFRQDRFMKSLAYFHIAQKWLDVPDGEINEILIDGGNPFVYWKAKAARDKNAHISGVTRGDETQALITCADRLSRASHRIIELGYPSSHAREITLDTALADQFSEWAHQYKLAMTTSQFHHLILVEDGIIPREVELALPESLDTGKARDFPEILHISDLHDFDFNYAPARDQVGWVVTNRSREQLPDSMKSATLLSPADALKISSDHMSDLISECDDISLKIPRKNHIKAAIRNYRTTCESLTAKLMQRKSAPRPVRLIPKEPTAPLGEKK